MNHFLFHAALAWMKTSHEPCKLQNGREKGKVKRQPLRIRTGGKSVQNSWAFYKRFGIQEKRWGKKPTLEFNPSVSFSLRGTQLLTWAGLFGNFFSLPLLLICSAQLFLLLNMDYAIFCKKNQCYFNSIHKIHSHSQPIPGTAALL